MKQVKAKHHPSEEPGTAAKATEDKTHPALKASSAARDHMRQADTHGKDSRQETDRRAADAPGPGPGPPAKPSPEEAPDGALPLIADGRDPERSGSPPPSGRPGGASLPKPGGASASGQAAADAGLQDQLLRLRADFDNFRKRTLRDKAQFYDTINQDLMLELLPVLDHLELAIQAANEHHADSTFCKGLQMIYDQLTGVLTKFGLEPQDAENQSFDPDRLEAVNYVPSDTQPEGTVIAETRRGYRLKNRLIRPAQVIVSSGPNRPGQDDPAEPVKLVKE